MPIPFLPPHDDVTPFPAVDSALGEPNGLLMAGGRLSPRRVLEAYRHGIFPWYEQDEPILWWSPDPRCVIWPERLRVTRSLAKRIRNGGFEVTFDAAFRVVMKACAAPRLRGDGTWITTEMIEVYTELHRFGHAHSVEVWREDRLVGGLYGIGIGRVFVGESMFSRERDASKVALVWLAQQTDHALIDCQLETEHLRRLGAERMPRAEYLDHLARLGDVSANATGSASGSVREAATRLSASPSRPSR